MVHDILIIDDEADIRSQSGGILSDEGYQTRAASAAADALASFRSRRPSLVLLDIWLDGSDVDGMGVLDAIKREHPATPVVMISGHGNIETAVAAIKRGAYDFLEKPFKTDRLLLLVERAIEAARLRRENEDLRSRAGGDLELTGASAAINQVRQAIDRVAPTGSRVMITGSAGVGKEVVARLIHARSRRAAGPFVALNCATMRPDRVERELFGGGDGETGPRKPGTLERAHEGTLFLDEVADMPLETQGKIVRVLQEQTFEPVGGNMRIEVDVRVVAATNRDLSAEIAAGHFREDLFYRLNVVPIRVPPLRERREDIPPLTRAFMKRTAEASGIPARPIADNAMAALQTYDWPGNARQLRNVVEWLLIMASGETKDPVDAEMLPPELRNSTPATLHMDKSSKIMALPLRDARELFERQYLLAQITRFGRNISRTAAFVGMERSALHRKLKALGVHGSDRPQGYET